MKLTKPLGLPALTAGLLLTASTALAQTISFDTIDKNNNDVLDSAELIEAFGSDSLLRFDQDDNGLSLEELRAAADESGDGDDDEFALDGNGSIDADDNNGHGNSGGFDPSNPGKSHEDRVEDEGEEEGEEEEREREEESRERDEEREEESREREEEKDED